MENEEQQILNIKVKYEDAINGILKYKAKIEELKSAIEDLKEQEKDKTITTKELKQQTEAINATIKEYQYNVRALQKEVQNNIRTENEQNGSLKQLRAELSNATKAFDEMSRAERNGAKGKELQKHINDITKEIKNAEEATQRFYRNVGNYEGAINNAIFGNSKFGQTLKSLAEMAGTGGAAGIIEGLTTKVKAFSTVVTSMVKNPYFLALAGVAGVGMAFKWFYDYNKGLLEATRLTREFTGYTGEALETMRNSITATADTMGKDFKDVLSTADALMSQYQLSGQEAMKIINDGFASGADLSGDMLEKIQQYAPTFHDAGINAEQMVAILQQTRSGIFSDKGLDLITMASKKIREMSSSTASSLDAIGISSKQVQKDLQNGTKTTFEVVKEVSTKMKSFGNNSKEVGAVLKDVFGKQGASAGLQLIEQLDTMTTKLDDVKQQTGAWGKTQEENIKIHKELNTYLSSMFDMSQKGFGSIIAQGKMFGTKILVNILKGLFNVINAFVDWYNNIMLVRGAIQTISTIFQAVWIVVKLVTNLIIDAFKQIGNSAKGLLDILEGIVTFDNDKAMRGYRELMDFSKFIKEGSKDVVKAGKEIGRSFSDAFNNTVSGRIQHLKLADKDGGVISTDTTNTKKDNKSTDTTNSKKTTNKNNTKTDTVSKDEAEKQKKEQKELQAAIALIQYEYNEKILNAKRMFISGMYECDKDYQQDLDDLQKEELNKMLDTYVAAGQIGEDKAQEMQSKLMDIYIQSKQQLIQQAKETANKIKEEFEIAERETEHNNIMSGNEGENTDEARLERYKAFLQQKIDANKEHIEVLKELWAEYDNAEIESENAMMKTKEENYKKNEESQKQSMEMMSSMISTMGDGLASFFEEEDKSLHNFLKLMLSSLLDAIEIAINAYYAQILAKEISNKSFAGVASTAALMAIIKTAFAGAKAMIKGFSVGGYVSGRGSSTSDSIPARLSNGESVMTAKATSMFSPILSAFNQLGGGVPIVVNNGQGQIGMDILAAAVARGYMMAPRPVVSVEEISNKQKRVTTIENRGRL